MYEASASAASSMASCPWMAMARRVSALHAVLLFFISRAPSGAISPGEGSWTLTHPLLRLDALRLPILLSDERYAGHQKCKAVV